MKPPKALIYFGNYSEADLPTACEFIVNSMTGNANFATPDPALSVIQTTLTNYRDALVAAGSRDRNKIAIKNQLRTQLVTYMNELGVYVNSIAKGDLVKLNSSGFKISKQPEPRHLVEPVNFNVKQGVNEGSLIIKVKAQAGAGYQHMITAAPVTENSQWITVASTRCQHEFGNLQPGQQYAVKIVITGSNQQTVSTKTLTQFAA